MGQKQSTNSTIAKTSNSSMTARTEPQTGSTSPPSTSSNPDLRPVYSFDALADVKEALVDPVTKTCTWDSVKALLGGKGGNLAEMCRLDIPVPPGFTITTRTCLDYLDKGKLDDDVWKQVVDQVKSLEIKMGKKFGQGLLLSCRSGAKISMPGMMDTILNLGMNEAVVKKMTEEAQGDLEERQRFVFDLYRRFVQMFGSIVVGVDQDLFNDLIEKTKEMKGVKNDLELDSNDWKEIISQFLVMVGIGKVPFPKDPWEQLKMAIEAVFKSWNGKRAIDYRNAAGIPHSLGTAVNIQVMVFGNSGGESLTGVAMSRNSTTGEKKIEGDYLMNAQGEDVVAGIRITEPLENLKAELPNIYNEFAEIAEKLEKHFKDMQDMEFTVEKGKLWLLQTRTGKRTAQASVRIAMDMVGEGLISKKEAVQRVSPEQIEFFLHPQLDTKKTQRAMILARGLNVSPGAGVGKCVLDADLAVKWKENGVKSIMVRGETKPDDVHGMIAAQGIITSRGGRTSHAALVARQFGKPAVVGVEALEIDMNARIVRVGDVIVREGDSLSIDGTKGIVYLGSIDTVVPDFSGNVQLTQLLEWADEFRELGVLANADYPKDAQLARRYGAEGIGLCRTEHMFFSISKDKFGKTQNRLPLMRKLIMAAHEEERTNALYQLLPLQRSDFEGLFKAMSGKPVTIRLLDPPLHEFLPSQYQLVKSLGELKLESQHISSSREMDEVLEKIRTKETMLERVKALHEQNPMLGTRGVRLGLLQEDISRMQVRAACEAAINCTRQGYDVKQLQIMIPLIVHVNELVVEKKVVEDEMALVMETDKDGTKIPYKCGVMIETPRGCLTADEIGEKADFFSFGSNDLTQCCYAMSRDDAESTLLLEYKKRKIFPDNPFHTLDPKGVGKLMRMACEEGRKANSELSVGICGEHGGEPKSIALCHDLGLDYVSCSPFRVPVARLAAAQAALKNPRKKQSVE